MHQGVRNVSLLEDLASFFLLFASILRFAFLPHYRRNMLYYGSEKSSILVKFTLWMFSWTANSKTTHGHNLMSFSCNNLFVKNKNSNQAEKALIKLSHTAYMSMGMESCLSRCLTSQFMESYLCHCLISQFMESSLCRCLTSQFMESSLCFSLSSQFIFWYSRLALFINICQRFNVLHTFGCW